jgi:hypothetical protein
MDWRIIDNIGKMPKLRLIFRLVRNKKSFIFAAHSERAELEINGIGEIGRMAWFGNTYIKNTGPVAQLNRAFDYGSKGFRFES